MRLKEFGPGIDPNKNCWVGIDQSYGGFGITILSEDNSYKTTVAKFDSSGVERLYEIQLHIWTSLKPLINLKDVAMEDYAYGSIMANKLGELGGTVKLALYALNPKQYPLIVSTTALKKYVTGSGKAGNPKSLMILHTYKKWGVEFSDDNAADSYGLAHIASGKASLSYEKEVYAKVNTAENRER